MKKRKGSALVVMIGVIAVLIILSTSLIETSASSFKISTSYDSTNRVNMMAQSGIDLAFNIIKSGTSLSVGDLLDTNSQDATINLKVSITNIEHDAIHTERIKKIYVRSTASKGSYTKTINVVLSKNTSALVADEIITTGETGTINGDISVNGAPGSVTLGEHINFTGNITYNAGITFPPVIFPASLDSLTPRDSISSSSTIDSDGKYDSIDLGNHDTLIINTNGNNLVIKVTTLTLKNSNISVEGTGTVKFYIDNLNIETSGNNIIYGDYYLSSSITFVNNVEVHGSVYSNAPNLTFRNSAEVYGGVIYAPESNIKLENSDFHASIVGNKITLTNSILIDPVAGTEIISPEGATVYAPYTIESWN